MKLILIFISFILVASFCCAENEFYSEQEVEDDYYTGYIDEITYMELLDKTNNKELFKDKPKKRTLRFITRSYTYNDDLTTPFSSARLRYIGINNCWDIGLSMQYMSVLKSDVYDSTDHELKENRLERLYKITKGYLGYKSRMFKFIIGDYKAKFGMGLTFANQKSISPGFSYDDSLPRKSRYRIHISSSAEHYLNTSLSIDNPYFRGVAAIKKIGMFDFNLFYSRNLLPLNGVKVNLNNTTKNMTVNNGVCENIYGAHINYKCGDINDIVYNSFGVTGYNLFRRYLYKSTLCEYNENQKEYFLGINDTLSYRHLKVDAEASINKKGDSAYIISIENHRLEKCRWTISYRNYSRDFYNPYAFAASRNLPSRYFRCRDEKGYTSKLDWKIITNNRRAILRIIVIGDMFTHNGYAKWNKSKEQYDIIYKQQLTDAVYKIQITSNLRNFEYGIARKIIDRDIYTKGVSSNDRKDIYTEFILKNKFQTGFLKIKYRFHERMTDILTDYYTGDYLNIIYSLDIVPKVRISGTSIISDPSLKVRNNERYSYGIKVRYKINKGFIFSSNWTTIHTSNKEYLVLETLEQIDYPSLEKLHKWKVQIDHTF